MKAIDRLSQTDLEKHRLWRFVSNRGDFEITPVKKLPCTDLRNKVASTPLKFADGTICWGLVGNFDAEDPQANEHFITLSLLHNGKWFHLARYFDFDYAERGPEAMAAAFAKPIASIFPISGSLEGLVLASPRDLQFSVSAKPSVILTLDKLMEMAVPKPKST
jgi:hypothetical protein